MAKKIVTIALSEAMLEVLDNTAYGKGISRSEQVKQLINAIGLGRDDVKPLVLQIPIELLKNKDELEKWFDTKKVAILQRFFPLPTKG